MVVQAVEGRSHGVCRWSQITVHLLDGLEAVQALSPAHLIFVNHHEATFTPIPINEGVDHGYLSHAFGLDSHGHHVIGAGPVEANIHDGLLSLLKKLDSSAQDIVLLSLIVDDFTLVRR